MKIQLAITFLTMFFCASFLNAQDTSKYESQTIYIQFNKYVKNGELYPRGFMGKNLKKEMLISPEGLQLFENYQKKEGWVMALNLVALASIGIGINSNNEALQIGMAITYVASMAINIPLSRSTGKDFVKAIWVRNRDALK